MDDLKKRLQRICHLHHDPTELAFKMQAMSFQHLSDEDTIIVHGLGDATLEVILKDAYVLAHIYLAGGLPGNHGEYQLSLVGEVDHKEVAILFEDYCRMGANLTVFNRDSDGRYQREMREAVEESLLRSRKRFSAP